MELFFLAVKERGDRDLVAEEIAGDGVESVNVQARGDGRVILAWLTGISCSYTLLQTIEDQPLVSGDIRTEIHLGWLNTILFVDEAFMLSIAELVGRLAPALAWPANIKFLTSPSSLEGSCRDQVVSLVSKSTPHVPPSNTLKNDIDS